MRVLVFYKAFVYCQRLRLIAIMQPLVRPFYESVPPQGPRAIEACLSPS